MDKTFLMLLEQTRIARERVEEAGRHLESYCNRSTGVRRITPDGIRGKGGHGDPTAWNVIGKTTLEQNYKATVDALLERKNQLEWNINADPAPDMKWVLYWRLICEHPWDEICTRLGSRYTERGLRRAIRSLIADNDQGRWRRMLNRAL